MTVTEARRLRGHEVDLAAPGAVIHGTVISVTRRTVWIISGDVDVILPLDQVVDLHPRTATV